MRYESKNTTSVKFPKWYFFQLFSAEETILHQVQFVIVEHIKNILTQQFFQLVAACSVYLETILIVFLVKVHPGIKEWLGFVFCHVQIFFCKIERRQRTDTVHIGLVAG